LYVGQDFSPQETDESEVLGLDFVNDVDHNETLMSSQWLIQAIVGTDPTLDPNPSAHLQGTSTEVVPYGGAAKTMTIQRVGGLIPGVTYVVRAEVVTTLGNTRSLWSHIRGVAAVT